MLSGDVAEAPAPSTWTTCWPIVLNGRLVSQQLQFGHEHHKRGEEWKQALKAVYLIVQSDEGMDTAFRRIANMEHVKTLAIGAYEHSLPLEVFSKPTTRVMPYITTLYLAWTWAVPSLFDQTSLFYKEVWGAVHGMREHLTRVLPNLNMVIMETNLDHVPHVSVLEPTLTPDTDVCVHRRSWHSTTCSGRSLVR